MIVIILVAGVCAGSNRFNNKCVHGGRLTVTVNVAEKSDLEKSLIANIVFELLAYTAEKERQKIKARQAEGIKLALAKGIHFGRKKTEIPENFYAECNKWLEGEQTAIATMHKLGMKKTTFYKIVNEQMPEIVRRC